MTSGTPEYAPDISAEEMFWQSLTVGLTGADANYERFMLAVATAWVRPGDFVMDLGANHGQHGRVLAAHAGKEGSLLMVEADPALAAELTQGAEASTTSVEVINAAVGDADLREITFFRHPTRDQEGSMFRRDEQAEYEELTVPGTSIDSLVAGRSAPTFIKIDVEGAEFQALKGSQGLLRDQAPLIACELSVVTWDEDAGTGNYTLGELVEWLAGVGWSMHTLDGRHVTGDEARTPGYRLAHYQCWLTKRDSRAEAYVASVVPMLRDAFAWGATTTPPYPFQLGRHPVLQPHDRSGLQHLDAVLHGGGRSASPVSTHTESAVIHQLEETIRRLRLKTEALEQTSFERERMVAWYAGEVANHRRRAATSESEVNHWRVRAESTDTRLEDVLSSTSWKTTLPIRAARRPRAYLKKMLQR